MRCPSSVRLQLRELGEHRLRLGLQPVDRAAHGGRGGEDGVAVDGEDGHGSSFDRWGGSPTLGARRRSARRPSADAVETAPRPRRRLGRSRRVSRAAARARAIGCVSISRCSAASRSVASGKETRKVAPPPGVSSTDDRAVQRLDDRRDDRQPEARAAGLAGARGVGAPEALEDLVADLLGDALAVVGDLDPAHAGRGVDADRAARWASPRP